LAKADGCGFCFAKSYTPALFGYGFPKTKAKSQMKLSALMTEDCKKLL